MASSSGGARSKSASAFRSAMVALAAAAAARRRRAGRLAAARAARAARRRAGTGESQGCGAPAARRRPPAAPRPRRRAGHAAPLRRARAVPRARPRAPPTLPHPAPRGLAPPPARPARQGPPARVCAARARALVRSRSALVRAASAHESGRRARARPPRRGTARGGAPGRPRDKPGSGSPRSGGTNGSESLRTEKARGGRDRPRARGGAGDAPKALRNSGCVPFGVCVHFFDFSFFPQKENRSAFFSAAPRALFLVHVRVSRDPVWLGCGALGSATRASCPPPLPPSLPSPRRGLPRQVLGSAGRGRCTRQMVAGRALLRTVLRTAVCRARARARRRLVLSEFEPSRTRHARASSSTRTRRPSAVDQVRRACASPRRWHRRQCDGLLFTRGRAARREMSDEQRVSLAKLQQEAFKIRGGAAKEMIAHESGEIFNI